MVTDAAGTKDNEPGMRISEANNWLIGKKKGLDG